MRHILLSLFYNETAVKAKSCQKIEANDKSLENPGEVFGFGHDNSLNI